MRHPGPRMYNINHTGVVVPLSPHSIDMNRDRETTAISVAIMEVVVITAAGVGTTITAREGEAEAGAGTMTSGAHLLTRDGVGPGVEVAGMDRREREGVGNELSTISLYSVIVEESFTITV